MEAQRKVDETSCADWQWPGDSTVGVVTLQPSLAQLEDDTQGTSFDGIVTWEKLMDPENNDVSSLTRPFARTLQPLVDEKAEDRLILLSKKYATSEHNFSREDEARLQIINSQMSLETPRYTHQDWAILDEARELLFELEER